MRSGIVALLLLMSPLTQASPVQVDGARFRTNEGHQILLRGVNVGGTSKVPPFQTVRGPEDFAPLRGWGFNTIRLLFNWEAYEPEPGVYNESYLQNYRQMVDWAAAEKLYTIVDIHQDGFSRFSIGGCGEGFPKWALPPFQTPATPDNGKNCVNWGTRMLFDIGMHVAWHHFYANTYGVRDRYMLMLQKLTAAVADAPNLVGFDLLNEPWGLENTELPALYADAGDVIQQQLPDAVLFLSSHALSSAGIWPSKLQKISNKNIVHASHFYDPGLSTFQTWSAWALNTALGYWRGILQSWQSPMFLGEFGAPVTLKNAADYIAAIYDVMDQELYSGAQWVYTPLWNNADKDGWNTEDFSINDDQGRLRGTYRPRPFVEETPGNLISMRWDEKALTLTVVYEATLETEALLLEVPDRLKWMGVKPEALRAQCRFLDDQRLRCQPTARGKGPRTFTFQFQPA